MTTLVIRPATAADAEAMARVHVESWRETYRGIMPANVLDDPGFVPKRTEFWTRVLADDRFTADSVAVAVDGEAVVGIALSQPPGPEGVDEHHQRLHVLYVLASHHGTGTGGALLDAVVRHDLPAALWVAAANPRARAFYRKHGFTEDGGVKEADGVAEVHMVRPPATGSPEKH